MFFRASSPRLKAGVSGAEDSDDHLLSTRNEWRSAVAGLPAPRFVVVLKHRVITPLAQLEANSVADHSAGCWPWGPLGSRIAFLNQDKGLYSPNGANNSFR
jgi:hypothetical protein